MAWTSMESVWKTIVLWQERNAVEDNQTHREMSVLLFRRSDTVSQKMGCEVKSIDHDSETYFCIGLPYNMFCLNEHKLSSDPGYSVWLQFSSWFPTLSVILVWWNVICCSVHFLKSGFELFLMPRDQETETDYLTFSRVLVYLEIADFHWSYVVFSKQWTSTKISKMKYKNTVFWTEKNEKSSDM